MRIGLNCVFVLWIGSPPSIVYFEPNTGYQSNPLNWGDYNHIPLISDHPNRYKSVTNQLLIVLLSIACIGDFLVPHMPH